MTATSPAPFAGDAKRILVIKHGAFGDVIQAEGALRDIRENHPDAFIAVLTMKPYRTILTHCPHVDEVIVDERAPRWRIDRMRALRTKIRARGFDMIYDLQNSKRTAFYFRWMLKNAPLVRHRSGMQPPAPRKRAEENPHTRPPCRTTGGCGPDHPPHANARCFLARRRRERHAWRGQCNHTLHRARARLLRAPSAKALAILHGNSRGA
ncbi:glycosyltransferase family 9 protein [Parvibaculum sp.]|uniref:glycosyltransferase family 9 protein n=1 Tax=Parvibaculum sp. TaxID=2024848 RepID=UPI003BAA2E2C